MTSAAAAPSDICEEVPAVTVLDIKLQVSTWPGLKDGGISSDSLIGIEDTGLAMRFFAFSGLPLAAAARFTSRETTFTGTISSFKFSALYSCSRLLVRLNCKLISLFLVMPYLAATFSAVRPMLR